MNKEQNIGINILNKKIRITFDNEEVKVLTKIVKEYFGDMKDKKELIDKVEALPEFIKIQEKYEKLGRKYVNQNIFATMFMIKSVMNALDKKKGNNNDVKK